jgi:hypothetical protein
LALSEMSELEPSAAEFDFTNDGLINEFFIVPEPENLQELGDAERELFHEAETTGIHEARAASSEDVEEVRISFTI